MTRKHLMTVLVLLIVLLRQVTVQAQEAPPSTDQTNVQSPDGVATELLPERAYVVQASSPPPWLALRTQRGTWAIRLDQTTACSSVTPGVNVQVWWQNGIPSALSTLAPDPIPCQIAEPVFMDDPAHPTPCAMLGETVCDIDADPMDWRGR